MGANVFYLFFFFFNDTATTEIYTLSLHDALPISVAVSANASDNVGVAGVTFMVDGSSIAAEDTTSPYSINWDSATATKDRKSTRLNSSHSQISYAVFCLKKKTTISIMSDKAYRNF